MLQIKQKFHVRLPHFRPLWSHKLEFSKPEPENDELIEAINDEVEVNDDDWQLVERPDTKELVQYWDKVEDDVRHDPEWKNISESDA